MSDKALSSLNNGTPVVADTGTLLYGVVNGNSRAMTVGSLFGSATLFTQSGSGAVARTIQSKLQEWFTPEDFGAVRNDITKAAVNRAAILAASLAADTKGCIGLMFQAGTYYIDDYVFPKSGQTWMGAGLDKTFIKNNSNNNPVFIFGDPTTAEGAAEFAHVAHIQFEGNPSGETLWGILCPNSPIVDGAANTQGQHEGVSNNSNNHYFGRWPFTPAEWTKAARGCSLHNVGVRYVLGGYALHVSAWSFRATGVIRLWTSKKGIRSAGASNANTYECLYVSNMSEEAIHHPGNPSVPKNTVYRDCIVQQCGWLDTFGTIALRGGEGTIIENLYLERNDENDGEVEIYVGASESNCLIQGVTHVISAANSSHTIIKVVNAHNCRIDGVDWRTQVGVVVDLASTTAGRGSVVTNVQPRNGAAGLVATAKIQVATPSLNHFIIDDGFIQYGPHKIEYDGEGFAFSQRASTADRAIVQSVGGVDFVSDIGNASTGGDFRWGTDGEGLTGSPTWLMEFIRSTEVLRGRGDGVTSIGQPDRRWLAGYFQELRTGQVAGDTLLLRAYDVNDATYVTFATLRANNTPTMDLDDSVTKASSYIYRGGGTDVAVADGGTGASSAQAACQNLRAPYVLAASAVQASHTGDTNETVLATVTIPANSIGANGFVRIRSQWSNNNSGNNKSIRIRLGGIGGTAYFQVTNLTTTVAYVSLNTIHNVNATNSQKGHSASSGTSSVAAATSAIDTTAAVDLVFTGQLANSGDTVSLEAYSVEVFQSA